MLLPVALRILTLSALLSCVSETETLVKARVKRFGVQSIVAAARMLHLLLVGPRYTRRCSKQRVLAPIATPSTMLRALSPVPVVTIR